MWAFIGQPKSGTPACRSLRRLCAYPRLIFFIDWAFKSFTPTRLPGKVELRYKIDGKTTKIDIDKAQLAVFYVDLAKALFRMEV